MTTVGPDILERLIDCPGEAVRGTASGQSFTARILIPGIDRAARDYFAGVAGLDRELAAMPFRHFGLSIQFDAPHRLAAFDAGLCLAPGLRDAVDRTGVCIFSNVVLPVAPDKIFQKNIFPDLKFHTDRGAQFDNQISLFYRNPADPAHRQPRRTSTLIIPNAVFALQAERQGLQAKAASRNLTLFDPEAVRDAVGRVMVEMPWDGPDGTGEVCLFDNRTVVHASHHDGEKHYPIAVQYLT